MRPARSSRSSSCGGKRKWWLTEKEVLEHAGAGRCRAGCGAPKEGGVREDVGEGRPGQREQPGGMGLPSACAATQSEEVLESEGRRGPRRASGQGRDSGLHRPEWSRPSSGTRCGRGVPGGPGRQGAGREHCGGRGRARVPGLGLLTAEQTRFFDLSCKRSGTAVRTGTGTGTGAVLPEAAASGLGSGWRLDTGLGV